MLQEKKTALHWGAINGHKDVCALLVEAHAEVNALDNVSSQDADDSRRHKISRINLEIIFNASPQLHLTSMMSLNVAVWFYFF